MDFSSASFTKTHGRKQSDLNISPSKRRRLVFIHKMLEHLSIGLDGFVSCTPAGIIELLKRSNIDIQGKNCVVVGRSNIVRKTSESSLIKRKWYCDYMPF